MLWTTLQLPNNGTLDKFIIVYCMSFYFFLCYVESQLFRYIARSVLVPFVYDTPDIQLGVLHQILGDAPAAFPALLAIGKKMENLQESQLKAVRCRITDLIGLNIDSRLATQYAVSILTVAEVRETKLMLICRCMYLIYCKCHCLYRL